MSADNGIYVLKTYGRNHPFEYRIAYAMAIDNLNYPNRFDGAEYLFGEAPVFFDEDKAMEYARFFRKQLRTPLEYGVVLLDYSDHKFPDPHWLSHEEHQRLTNKGGMEAYGANPVFESDGQWYFFSENWDRVNGPHANEECCRMAIRRYSSSL